MSRRTMGDDLGWVERLQVNPDLPTRRTSQVQAPCCGRECSADCIQDYRGSTSLSRDWLCDGCRGRVRRDPSNDWTQSGLLQAAGAPWKTARKHRVQEKYRELANRKRGRGESYVTSDLMAEAERAVPSTRVDLTP